MAALRSHKPLSWKISKPEITGNKEEKIEYHKTPGPPGPNDSSNPSQPFPAKFNG
jgi:hypothetical protein